MAQAGELFAGEEQTSESNKCWLKVNLLCCCYHYAPVWFWLAGTVSTPILDCSDVKQGRNQVPGGMPYMQVAQFSAELERYQPAVAIYEDVARTSMDNNLLKYSAKGYLLCAGICWLCGAVPCNV